MSRLQALLLRWADQDRGPILLLAIVAALFFLPAFLTPGALVWPHSGLGSDISYRHWPDLINYAANLKTGHWVLWDSSVALGRPLAGDPATLFLYPFDLFFIVLPPALAFNLIDALHVFLAGLFTFLFLRFGYGISRPAALLAGLSFAFMPKFISHLAGGHVGVVWGLTWAPAVLFGLKLAFDGSLLAAALAGVALAVQLPNHIQQPYYMGVIGSAFWLWHIAPLLWRAQSQWKQVGRLVLVYIVWLVAFGLTAAAVLLPLIEMLPYNSRGVFTLADANLYALPPPLLLTLLAPSTFQFPEWTMYLGLLPLVLGILGWRAQSHRVVWFFGLLAAFALIYAVGLSTPLFGLAFAFIPGFRLLRVPTRLWFFGGLAMAVLSGFGADRLTDAFRQTLQQHRRRLLQMAVLYFVVNGAVLIGYLAFFRQWHAILAFQMMSAAVLVIAGRSWLAKRLSTRAFQWALIPILLLDLLPVAADQIDLIQPQDVFLRSTPALDFVSAQPGIFRIYSPAGDLPYPVAAARGVESLEGLLAFQIGHAVNAIREAAGCGKISYATAIPPCLTDKVHAAVPDAARLGALNVRYVLSSEPLAGENFKLVLKGEPAVYENLLWQARARTQPPGAGTAEIVKRESGIYQVRAQSTENVELIVSETWLPGWQAKVDGEPRPVERVEDALLGVALTAGEHEVMLHYWPLGWTIGWPISLASLAGLVTWAVFDWRRRIS